MARTKCALLTWSLYAPSLADVVREAARDGKLHLRVLPLFLAAGAHVAEDIPRQIAACSEVFSASQDRTLAADR